MSFRKFLFSACLLLAGLFAANSVLAQVYSFRVTDGTNTDPDNPLHFAMRPVLDLPELKAGEPFLARVEALDVDGQRVTNYNRDVQLQLRARLFDQNTTVVVPADEFVDGVAVVEVTPIHAGRDNMRFRVTDGNITTDDASSIFIPGVHYPLGFSIQPAGFDVTYIGGNQPLRAHAVLENRTYFTRIRALNSDGSHASAWRGTVELRGQNLGGSWTAYIGTGGISDYDHRNPASLALSFDLDGMPGPVSEVLEASIDGGETWEEASDPFDVLEAGTDRSEITLDRLLLQGERFPGNYVSLRYRLNNGGDDPTAGAIDTLFLLVDPQDNDRVLLQWTEQYSGTVDDDSETSDLWTSFQVPLNLLGNREYELWIRPNYSQDEQEELTIAYATHPDLRIEQFDYAPGEYRGGDAVRFHLAFENLVTDTIREPNRRTSAVPHDQSYKLQLHLSSNPLYGDEDDFVVWEGLFTGNEGQRFLPGQRIDVTGDFMLPDNFDGTYYLFARINSHSNEGGPAAGRDGRGFQPESYAEERPGNNTTAPRFSHRLTILPRQATETFRVSLTQGDGQSDGTSDNAVLSSDGRYVAFESYGNLAGLTGVNVRNVFVRSVNGNDTFLVSSGMSGAAADGHSGNPSISGDGRHVAFQSSAGNLVSQNLNGFSGIFVRDVQAGLTRVLTVNPWTNEPANHGSQLASMSSDGRFVVFESGATNLLEPGDAAADGLFLGRRQVYLYDRSVDGRGQLDVSGNTAITLVSRNGDQPAVAEAVRPRISADGKVVTFVTQASNILSADPHFSGASSPFPQVIRWNRENNRMTVVSVGLLEDPADPASPSTFVLGNNTSGYPAISGSGEYIAFASRAQNLTADGYFNSIPHVFRVRIHNDVVVEVLRMNASNGSEPNASRTALTPVLGSYEPALSEDGQMLAFASDSSNLLPPIGVRNVDHTRFESTLVQNYADDNAAGDVYLFDLSNPDAPRIRRASVSSFGYGTTQRTYGTDVVLQPPASRRPAISADGRFVAFTSDAKMRNGLIFGATNYIYGATNGNHGDIYVFDLKERAGAPPPPAGTLPTASLLTPSFGSVIGSGSSLPLVAQVRPGSSAVTQVSFYAMSSSFGTIHLGDGVRHPPSDNYVLHYTSELLAGDYNLVVAVRDENGNYVSSSPVAITIRTATQSAPTIQLTGPVDGENIAVDSTVILSAFARHDEGDVTQVDFYANGNLIGTDFGGGIVFDPDSDDVIWWRDEFSFSIGRTFVSSASFSVAGTYSIVAVARDEFGNLVTSDAHTLNVLPQTGHRPSVSMLQPTGSFFGSSATSGSSMVVAAEAHDVDGEVALLEIYANGNLIVSKTNPGPTLTGVWEIPHVPGIHQIYAVATDDSGNRSVSSPVSVTVRLATKDGPVIQFRNPSDGEWFSQNTTVPLAAVAGHHTGNVARVIFYANGQQIANVARFPWLGMPDDFEFDPFFPTSQLGTFMANWATLTPGTFELVAVAEDTHGNRTATEVRTVEVRPMTIEGSRAPVVQFRQPVQNSSATSASNIPMSVRAWDPDGDLLGVQFRINGQPAPGGEPLPDGTESGFVPRQTGFQNHPDYPFTLNFAPPAPGIYVITAVGIDTSGNRASAWPARVITSTTGDRSIALNKPSLIRRAGDNPVLNTGAHVLLEATADFPSGVNGAIERVVFYMNGQRIGSDSTPQVLYEGAQPQYTTSVSMTRAGLFEFYVVAYDDRNNAQTSDPIYVTVRPPIGALPDITMIYPEDLSEVTYTTTKSSFPVVAIASDADQDTRVDPVAVEFFVDRGQHALARVSDIDDETGAIEDIDVDFEGYGYAYQPDVLIVGDGEEATAVAVLVPGPGGWVVDDIIVTNGGRNYTHASVVISGGGHFVGQYIGRGIQEHQSTHFRIEDNIPGLHGFSFVGLGTGAYRIYGIVTDNQGNQRRSTFYVPYEDQAIHVEQALSEPAENVRLNVSGGVMKNGRRHFEFNEMANFVITGDDSDGRLQEVEFFFNGVSLNALENSPNPVESAPWQYSGNIIVAGDYNVFALVTDNSGVTTMSHPVWITVANPATPTATIQPLPTEAYVGMPLTINVSATPGVGTVREVQLFVNNNPMLDAEGDEVILTSPPYRFRWTPGSTGHHVITARVVNSYDQPAHSEAVGINILPLGQVIGDPSDPSNHAGFVSQIYFDILGRAPRLVELETFVNELATGARSRGEVIAKVMTDANYNLVPWVIVTYLTALGEFPTVDQLEDGLAVLRNLPEDIDEEDLGVIPGAPFGLPLVVAQALASDEFWFKFSQRGNQMHQFELLDIVWERNLGRSWTAPRKAFEQEEIEFFGRNIYIAQLAAESFDALELRARLGSLVLLLLDRNTTQAEVNELRRRFGTNIAAAADFIVSEPEFGRRFPVHQGGFFGQVTGGIFGTWDHETELLVKSSNWFGIFNDSHFDWKKMRGWFRHKEHGWVYVVVNQGDPQSMWMWDDIQRDWLWSRPGIYGPDRILWSDNRKKWIFIRQGAIPDKREIRVFDGAWGPSIVIQP